MPTTEAPPPRQPRPTTEALRAQHRHRMSWMPWLYFRLKPKDRAWARAWQRAVHAEKAALEQLHLDPDCFIAPDAALFAEPHRDIWIGPGSHVAAGAFLHGPLRIGAHVGINHGVSLDGGAGGIEVGEGTRIAAGARIYAWDHGTAPERAVRDQPVRSRGIQIGADCWIGANAGVTDGVQLGDGCVVGMGAVVTRDVPAGAVVGGAPARIIGWRGGSGG
jgi:acetyltransferase-like isoleucine patch superfamily enzyme